MNVENRTKTPIFPPPVHLTPRMKGLPLEFGIGVRCPECFYDGAIRWCKKFSDRFSRFDTIPAVTDSHPATHPASHVAVAITLYAKASSLKMNCLLTTVNAFHPYNIDINESWCNRDIGNTELNIPGYNLFRKHRPVENKGGVVLLYVC